MKKLFRQIKCCDRNLEDVAVFTASVHLNPYYEVNNAQDQQEKDLNTCNKVFGQYLKEKYALLENLQIEIEKEKHQISQIQRKLTLQNHV